MNQKIPRENLERIRITSKCQDCDYIPKVINAGEVVEGEDGIKSQIMFNGIKVVAGGYYGNWMQQIIENLGGHHEPQKEKVFFEVLKILKQRLKKGEEMAILELGAFWSYYSLWFLKEFPQAKAMLIDSDLNNLEIGKKNFRLNNFAGYFSNEVIDKSKAHYVDFIQESDKSKVDVKNFDLLETMKINNIEKINVLMCDILGGEEYYFHKIEEELRKKKIEILFISTHHQSISGSWLTHENLLKYLVQLGGHIIAEHSVSESFSGDGLIVISFNQELNFLKINTSRARNNENIFLPLESELEAREQNTLPVVYKNNKQIVITNIKNKIKVKITNFLNN
jgi:hypothetical protein